MAFPQLRSRGYNQLTQVQPAGAQYVLTADSDLFVWTGQPVSLYFSHKVSADAGSYSWTGTDVTFRKTILLTASSGSWGWTGSDASLLRAIIFTADAGSFSWTGGEVSFLSENPYLNVNPEWQRNYPRAFHPSHQKPFRQAAQVSYTLSAEEGTHSWTGDDASLEFGHEVTADPGVYNWSGVDAFLNYDSDQITDTISISQALAKYRKAYPRAFHPGHKEPFRFGLPQNFSLSAETASYVWTGTDATTTYTPFSPNVSQRERKHHSWPRPFAPSPFGQLRSERNYNLISGQANLELVAETTEYSWAGIAATVQAARQISAESGSFSWTGTDATLNFGFTVTADPGTYSWTGTDANLEYGYEINAETGAWVWTGTNATLAAAPRVLVADSGAWTWTGTIVPLYYNYLLTADEAEYEANFGDVGLIWSAQPQNAAGRMMLLGVG